MLRMTWQMSSKTKFSAYFDEVDKFRGHDMQALFDPEEAAVVWNSPAYSTGAAKITYTATSRLLFEGGYSRNLEYYTYSYQDGIGQARWSPAWYANAGKIEVDLGGSKTASVYEATRSPRAAGGERLGVVRHRLAQHEGGRPDDVGHVHEHARQQRAPAAELPQQLDGDPVLGARHRHRQQLPGGATATG